MKGFETLWPTGEFLDGTLGTDAHTLDKSVFLAVHQPMQFRRVEYGKSVENAALAHEQDMLRALLADDGEGRVIVPIAGASGVGKSHVIRWLEAELESRDDADTRHVILIPKSSSLKSVLRRILSDLDGPRYDKIRESLEKASESLPNVAARDLRTRLISVLESEASASVDRRRSGSPADKRADAQSEWGAELAGLLDDPELWSRHFYGTGDAPNGIMARLAEHVTKEGTTNRRHEFEFSDFENLLEIVEVKELSPGARKLIARLTDRKYQQLAADVLNGVLDQAKQDLLDLGGTPLSEVFLELRVALLEDGKELVILVEDFAVLSGMQGALLDALIHEARIAGEQKYCVIRSAIAYTLGYQPMQRDTIMTRARVEWIIEDVPGDEGEILKRAIDLVGAFWNAARWGIDALRDQHRQASGQRNWIRSCEPEDLAEEDLQVIEAFGRSGGGYPLFPLNAAAIRRLVSEKCVVNDRLVFNPRLIIDRVVLDIAKLRQHFESSAFPPRTLGTCPPIGADIAQVISRQAADQQDRLLILVTYWADLPETLADAAVLPATIYRAFGLQPLDFGKPAAILPKPPSQEWKPGVPPSATSVPEPLDPFLREWKPKLDKWQAGNLLGNADARNLRNWITEAVTSTLPLDWPGSRPSVGRKELARSFTFLPNARGAEGLSDADAAISLCGSDVWSDPLLAAPIRYALEAIVRFHGVDSTKNTWNYSGAELHAAHYGKFVSERRGKLLEWFVTQRASKQQLADYSVVDLVESRLMSAAVLGVGVKGGNRLDSAIDILFRDLHPLDPVPDLPERWQRLQEEAHRNGEQSRADLIELVAARQGSGSKLLGVDVAVLHGPVREFLKSWELTDGPKDKKSFDGIIRRGIGARQEELRAWYSQTVEWLGEEFDKAETIEEIRELLNESNRFSLCHADDVKSVRVLLDQFRDAPVAEALGSAKLALREPLDGTTLPALANDYSKIVQVTADLGEQLRGLFDKLDDTIDAALDAGGMSIVKKMIGQVASEFSAIQGILDDYAEIRSNEG